MNPFKRIKTEEQLARLSYDLDIARAKVYKQYGFTLEEIAVLVDRPDEDIRDAVGEDDIHSRPIATVYAVNHELNLMLVGYPEGDSEWVPMNKHFIYDTKGSN